MRFNRPLILGCLVILLAGLSLVLGPREIPIEDGPGSFERMSGDLVAGAIRMIGFLPFTFALILLIRSGRWAVIGAGLAVYFLGITAWACRAFLKPRYG